MIASKLSCRAEYNGVWCSTVHVESELADEDPGLARAMLHATIGVTGRLGFRCK